MGADNLKGLKTFVGMMIALMLIVVVLPGRSSADDDSLMVILILESDPIVSYGDQIEVRIFVFDQGIPADAEDNPELKITPEEYEFRDRIRNFSSVRVGVGEYIARANVLEDEINTYRGIEIELRDMYGEEKVYAVRVGRENDEDNVYDYLGSWEANLIEIKFDRSKNLEIRSEFQDIWSYPWGPGDRIDLSVDVLLNGERWDADAINWSIDHHTDFDPFIEATYVKKETGSYDFFVWIPENLTRNAYFSLEIQAVVGEMETFHEIDFPVVIYHLWCHKEPSGLGELNCNLYVSDNDGLPVMGAVIDAYYQSNGYKHLTGKTDVEGKARFVFTTADQGDIHINGWITKDGKNQSFGTSVTIIPENDESDEGGSQEDDRQYYPWYYGVDVLEADGEIREENGKFTKEYIAYYDGFPLRNRSVFYIIFNPYEYIVGHGEARTGPGGRFKIEFQKPETWISSLVYFKVQYGYHRTVWIDVYNWIDSDSDGYSDDFETWEGTDPADQFDHPYMAGGRKDSDYDGVCDQEENFYGTNASDGFDSPKYEPYPNDPRWTDHNSTDGLAYGIASDLLFISLGEDIDIDSDAYSIKVDKLDVGGRTMVHLKPGENHKGGLNYLEMYYLVGDIDDVNKLIETGETPDWTSWTNDQSVYLYNHDGTLKGVFLTPTFLPAGDQEYTILGGGDIQMNSVVVRDGQSRRAGEWDSGEEGISPFLIVIIIILIILIIAALGVSGFFGISKLRAEKARKDSEMMMEELIPEKKSIVDEVMSSDIYAMTGPSDLTGAPPPAQMMTSAIPAQPAQGGEAVGAAGQNTQTSITMPSEDRPEILPWEIEPSMDFFSTPPVNGETYEDLKGPPVVEGEIHMGEDTPHGDESLKPVEEAVPESQTGVELSTEAQPEVEELAVTEPVLEESERGEPVTEKTPVEPPVSEEKSRIDDLFD